MSNFKTYCYNGFRSLTANTGAKGMNGEETATSSFTQKQHRRAQVRKAQIEHRQRKENYVKHLEQDVIRLRDWISKAETEAAIFQGENSAIRNMLSQLGSPPQSSNFQSPEMESPTGDFTNLHSPRNVALHGNPADSHSPQHDLQWPSSASSSSLVSISFDELIDASCLQISPSDSFATDTEIKASPDALNFSIDGLALGNIDTSSNGHNETPLSTKAFSKLPDEGASHTPSSALPDLSSIAINFILALEHPCRKHFHAPPKDSSIFDPTGDPSGHELMASTFLYSHAPAPVFTDFENVTWTSPSLQLNQLYQMSQSLNNSDFEITPVQAWFLLAAQFDAGKLLEGDGPGVVKLDELKKQLAGLVHCFAFGAVLDERLFWDAVTAVMGNE